jgi:hypothetical protein
MSSMRNAAATGRGRPKVLVGLVIAVGVAGCIALAWVLLNPAPPAARGAVAGAYAPMSTVAHTYVEAAKHQDCGMTRVLTTSNTWAWCDDPRLISYKSFGRTGDDGECISYMLTITASSDGSMEAGTEPWSFCFRQTNAGWRLWDQGQS